MKPPLKSKKDREFLWSHLRYIDAIESDHAPHTKEEKDSDHPPHGVPGLETTLPLLLTAYHQNRITLVDIIRLCYEGPIKILHLQKEEGTTIEVDMNQEYTISNKDLKTKCAWSPFAGWRVKGKVRKVTIRGQKAFEDGIIYFKPGEGRVISRGNA
jgi:carbamoyl-phosphate synthase/aspartate carbamoyltransferase/dihydroorotase